ncbi:MULTISPECIES: 16S rRNA (cytidine(1402)-2'-O)-methyltransferase [unclassified Sulfitobacter]|uniref:16S rRNA (cytidine(1402)-2'-O)-methyltransferase n=1 Tax=unclassified Sulfitobacter TaxID=196795 RepID=UPI0023E18AC9|nr:MULTISPECIES: 16S rRNA (cytidine(1402)-2'-O)-methyltransferase [unclassified Sulfitobacter]MDF3384321.1 16S rRNA (cytidine(1402)-2'-O)-methyltransferase [Sulfitobacter sp. Ks11]MDF3387739.1 16S rRNA (cytidine(1402)-2'-O)-methyltransferase [Sulfitobacter sp. M85]MDF3391159.1 16S rRNA (cytidine(1402)-2'-O)-methyltransferase [Sulfitobacter sp. Ks16]MDF3401797.1 16S rRNA (cytidine(1402)-2'-O)-methyltransferase [Sulfitobacter sp. KE39]MDF3405218.1 16S rRNA (cytidine(1402)-2'-O)-methyltransferase
MKFDKTELAPGLYFVGVPIGTARDITLRALDTLASADLLAAEDTRSLRRLMEIHGVPLDGRKVLALHDHSGTSVEERLIAAICEGKSVAYASEAGMPLIADPGFELSRAAAEAGVMQTCAPGPSAVLTALALGALPTDAFFFAGFLPNSKSARIAALEKLRDVPGTLVFYESPKRLGAMLRDAATALGAGRKAAMCRELTKKFEEIQRDTLENLAELYQAKAPKGEVVVLIDRSRSDSVNHLDLETDLQRALTDMSMRDAVDLVAQAHGLPRRQVYQAALALGKG